MTATPEDLARAAAELARLCGPESDELCCGLSLLGPHATLDDVCDLLMTMARELRAQPTPETTP